MSFNPTSMQNSNAKYPPNRQDGQRIFSVLVLSVFTLLLLSGLFWSRLFSLPILAAALNLLSVITFAIAVLFDLVKQRLSKLVLLWAVVVLIFSILSLLGANGPSVSNSVITAILFTKIFMVAYLFSKLDERDLHYCMSFLALFHIIGILLNLGLHEFFVSLMTKVSFQLDTSRLIGFTLTANKAAAISMVLALYYWFVRKNRLLFAIFLIALAFTFSRSLVALFVGFFLYATFIRGTLSKNLLIAGIVTIAAALFLLNFGNIDDTFQKIDNTVNGNLKYIRAAMLFGGIQLAVINFPFGTGGGTYGSSFSRGSSVYDQLDIGSWETVIDGTGIFDSGIGSVLGEYGVAGLILVTVLLWNSFRLSSQKYVPKMDIAVMVSTVLFLSFFRTIFADFFYSIIVFVLFFFLKIIRERVAADAHSSRSQ